MATWSPGRVKLHQIRVLPGAVPSGIERHFEADLAVGGDRGVAGSTGRGVGRGRHRRKRAGERRGRRPVDPGHEAGGPVARPGASRKQPRKDEGREQWCGHRHRGPRPDRSRPRVATLRRAVLRPDTNPGIARSRASLPRDLARLAPPRAKHGTGARRRVQRGGPASMRWRAESTPPRHQPSASTHQVSPTAAYSPMRAVSRLPGDVAPSRATSNGVARCVAT